MFSRRKFLQNGPVISLSPLLPNLLANTARAAAAESDAPALVVIQLDGGNDGINTVVPYGDDAYNTARNKLRLKMGQLHKLDDLVGLHPNMQAAKELFDDGRLAIVQGVGYPNPNRSHFRSMKIWHSAQLKRFDGYGWLGKALDQQKPVEADPVAAGAIYVGEQETPFALWGRRSTTTALSRAEDIELQMEAVSHGMASSATIDGSIGQFVSRQVLSAYAAADQFATQHAFASSSAATQYPKTKLATQLKLVSQLLQGGCRARVFYAIQTGYDTHATQLYAHGQLLREFSGAIKSFLNDLRQSGLSERIVVLAFSEFGRRVKENGSLGTDHGTAGPVFLAGDPIAGGLIGDTPSLSDLEGGDLKVQIDFRKIYATLLDKWLAVKSSEILGSKFETLPILGA